jgi:cytochrome P450
MQRKLSGREMQEARHLLKTRRADAWIDIIQRYGTTFWYPGGVATADPHVVQALLIDRVHTQQRSHAYKTMARLIPGADGVLFRDGDAWVQHARAVMPVFHRSHIDSFPALIHETVLARAARWRTEEPLPDLFTAVTEIGTAIILRVGYGFASNDPLGQQLGNVLKTYKDQTMNSSERLDEFGLPAPKLTHLPQMIRTGTVLKRQVQEIRALVQEVIRQRAVQQDDGNDWISRMHCAGLPLHEIADEVNHLYGAFTAIDFIITAAFYELSRNPELVPVLRTELDHRLIDRAYPTHDDLALLPHTRNFLHEVLRRYPVSMGVARHTGTALIVGDIHIPAHTEVFILLYGLQHHPDFWTNPEVFDVYRWETTTPAPYTFVPFLEGPRKCIGRYMAEMHFVVVLNALLQHYDFQVLDHTIRLTPYLIPRFERAMPAIVHRRVPQSSGPDIAR